MNHGGTKRPWGPGVGRVVDGITKKPQIINCSRRNCQLLPRCVQAVAAMSKEIRSPQHEALRKLTKLERTRAELKQAELAQRLGWDQTTISDIETGAKRVTAIELIQLGKALGFNPGAALNRIAKVPEE